MTEPLVYRVDELPALLQVGRHTARRIAQEIGIRVSPRRVVVPKARLDEWLAARGGDDAAVQNKGPGRNQPAGTR